MGASIFTKMNIKEKIVNKQFEMIGASLEMKDIIIDGMVNSAPEGKKEKMIGWWEVYKFENVEQYEEWKKWGVGEMEKAGIKNPAWEMDKLDMQFGMAYKY